MDVQHARLCNALHVLLSGDALVETIASCRFRSHSDYLPQNDIVDAHQGSWGWLLHLVNQGQLAVEVFFLLSGMLFYKSAAASLTMHRITASRCAQFVITRCLRLWPIMIFCSILLLPSPMVPNRAAAAWTLLLPHARLRREV